jgi:hypothetical protein
MALWVIFSPNTGEYINGSGGASKEVSTSFVYDSERGAKNAKAQLPRLAKQLMHLHTSVRAHREEWWEPTALRITQEIDNFVIRRLECK